MVAALYRRYRPESFAEMIGQQQVTEPLSTAITSGRINHAYLFSGPRGCGKTSSARILARCLNCAQGPTPTPCGVCDSCVELGRDGGGSLDVLEIDAASHGGVDDARELRERAVMAPSRDRYRIFIIDEAHMVTPSGFNALLKVVEEPPEHVLFIFATTEPEKVIGTIRSRTHHYPFRLIPPAPMLEYLERICAAEGVQAQAGVLPLVVRAGGGSARDTLSLLDQLIAGTDGDTMGYQLATQLLGFTAQDLLDDTISSFADGEAAAAYRAVDSVIQSGQDPRRFVEDLLERVRDLIIVKAVGQSASSVLRGVAPAELDRMFAAAARFNPRALSGIADVVNDTLTEMVGVTAPRLQLELMVARILVKLRATFGDGAGAADAGQDAPVPAARAAATEADARGGLVSRGAGAGARDGSASQGARAGGAEVTARDEAASLRADLPSTDGARGRAAAHEAQVEQPPRSVADVATAAWGIPGVAGCAEASSPVRADGARSAEPERGGYGERQPGASGASRGPDEVTNPARSAEPGPEASSEVADERSRASSGPAGASGSAASARPSDANPEAGRVLDFGQVRDAWPSVLEAVQRLGGRSAWSVVQGLTPMKCEDGLLAVWFPNRGVFNQARETQPGQPSPADLLKQALHEVLGTELKIAPKIGRSSGRESGPSRPEPDEDHHRGSERPAGGAGGSMVPEPVWNVAPIPGEPAVADDGPGSGWDEFASGEPAPGSPSASHNDAHASVRPGTVHPTPSVEETAVESVDTLDAVPTNTWKVAAVPGAQPQESAAELEPELEQPVRRHPALRDGGERYGESVIRELLGARFVGEEPRVAAVGEPVERVPDDFEAPPEEE